MKIVVEKPFNFRFAYLRNTESGRKLVDLFNSNDDRTTISYARYLMCVKLGYILSEDFEVDHIDEDRTNDSIENLQVLTKDQHIKKTNLTRSRSVVVLCCPQCGIDFLRFKNQIKVGSLPKCSRRCNGLYSRLNQGWGL